MGTCYFTSQWAALTEVCKLVRLYLLNKIKHLLGTSNEGIYKDNGLATLHKANDPKLDILRKYIISWFKVEELSILIDTNLIETDFLDVSSISIHENNFLSRNTSINTFKIQQPTINY